MIEINKKEGIVANIINPRLIPFIIILSMYLSIYPKNTHADGTLAKKLPSATLTDPTDTGIVSDGNGDTPVPSLFTGAMVYALPLKAPNGRNDLTPNLVLRYNSNNFGTDVGVGWTFGIGAINRNPPAGVNVASIDLYAGTYSDLFAIAGPEYGATLGRGGQVLKSRNYVLNKGTAM